MPIASSHEDIGTFDQALDRLAEDVGRLGFESVDYAYLPRTHSPRGDWVTPYYFDRNFPNGWRKRWARFANCDPFYRSTFGRNLPADWDQMKDAPWLTSMQQDAVALAFDVFADAISVPVHLPGGGFAMVSAFNRSRNDWRKERDRVEQSLLMIAHSFHAFVAPRFLEGLVVHPRPDLTPREIECLKWTAQGMTRPEIAAAINRSVETVRFHLKNAMVKLGARTSAQAVAEAILLGYISNERVGGG